MLAQDLCSALRENLSPRGPAQALFSVREEKRRSFSFLLLCGLKSFSSYFHPFFLSLSVYFLYFSLFPKSYSFYHASSTHTQAYICMYICTYTHTHPNIYTNVSLSFVVLHFDVQEVNIHIHQSNIHTYRIALCLTVLVLFFSYLTDLQICFLL